MRCSVYTILLILIYLAFISLGLPDSLLGSAWPAMHTDIGVPTPYMGIISMVISGGTIISSLLSDKVTRRFGTAAVTVTSVFLTALALLGFSFSRNMPMLLLFAVPYGLGAGSIDAALNNYVAVHYTSRHMSWLHCFWGVGTIISPIVMSHSLTRSGWAAGYRAVGAVQLGIGLILLVTLPIWKIHKDTVAEDTPPVRLRDALRIKGVPTLLTGFFAYCAQEATCMGWASTYMAEEKGFPPEKAAGLGSLFFIGITAGRFLSGFIMNRLGDRRMIIIGTGILSAGIVMLCLPGSPVIACAGFLVIGLGCAPIYPCIIHSTPSNFGADKSGAIIGIQMASAYIGSTFMPPLFGVLGNALGFGIMPLFIAFFVILMITMNMHTFAAVAGKTPISQK